MATAKDTNTPKVSRVDFLSVAFVLSALFCLAVSIPATFSMATLTHDNLLAGLLVGVLELMAFSSKFATRWVRSWEVTLDRVCQGLLAVTTLANFIVGWDYLWQKQLTGLAAQIRDAQVIGIYPGAILLVLVLSALVPAALYMFLTLFIKRQLELETLWTPEEAARRALEPITIQVQAARQLDLQVAALLEQRNQLFGGLPMGALPAPVPVTTAPRVDSEPVAVPMEQPVYPKPQPVEPVKPTNPHIGSSFDDFLAELPQEEQDAIHAHANELVAAEQQRRAETVSGRLDALLSQAGMTRDDARTLLARYRITEAGAAYRGLKMLGHLPVGMSEVAFYPLFGVLMGQPFCTDCGAEMNPGAWGVATKYARKHNQEPVCTNCRNK